MEKLLQMKNNLIQNFYVIGLPIEDIININSVDDNDYISDIFSNPDTSKVYSPKIISKFPPSSDNYNTILDQLIIDHCFPYGLTLKEGKRLNEYTYHFEFELDNKIYNYIDKNKYIYSKIHFTCLTFFESVRDYKRFKDNINLKFNIKNNNKNEFINNFNNIKINDKNIESRMTISTIESHTYYIPKVICFASLLPFPNELYQILVNIYDLYNYQNIKHIKNKCVCYPIEKVVEQVIMSLPLPISNACDIILSFDLEPGQNYNFNIHGKILSFPTITFPSFDIRDYYLNNSYDLDMREIFNYLSEEDVIKIFKNIIFEVPILFFCDQKELLSNVIEGFLNILSPFKYVLPCITILPSKYFGFIHSQDKFIFGINQQYDKNFFKNNNIILNKNIMIIILNKSNSKSEIREETVKKADNDGNKKIYINQNLDEGLENNLSAKSKSADLPLKYKKELLSKLKSYINEVNNKKKKDIYEDKYIFNSKIRHIFHEFFINILSGYTNYLLKGPSDNYFGDGIRHKYNGKNGLVKYIKEIFNYDEFICNFPKDDQLFYNAFFNTELFFNFMRGIIYPNNEIDSIKHKLFDFLTFVKKDKGIEKNEDFKEQYEKYKKSFEPKKNAVKKYISISHKYYFDDEEKKILIDKDNQKTAFMLYNQLIELNKNDNNKFTQMFFTIKYYLFPKLLFDNKFFKIDYNSQFYRHYLELPNDNIIKKLNELLATSESNYILKYCSTIYPRINQNPNASMYSLFFGHNNSSSNIVQTNANQSQNISFYLYIHNYIEYNWLLLLSCSLWYCNTSKELDQRINIIFDIIERLDYLEEQVLYFIFYSLYKYSDIGQFVRMFQFIYRFIGCNNYYDLLLLFQKFKDMKNSDDDNDNNNKNKKKEKEEIIQKRSFIDATKYITKEESGDKFKEEIIFYPEIKCDKCGKIDKLNVSDIINRKITKDNNDITLKCNSCSELISGEDIFIKYSILLCNIKKNNKQIINEGVFKLVMPHILYQKIKNYLIVLKDNKIDIDHIFSNENINLLNFIFYFSLNNLPFDFLIPYENNNNININKNREYINSVDINTKQEKKLCRLSLSKNDNFCINGIKN